MHLRWASALALAMVVAGCSKGIPVSHVHDCGTFDVGERTYLTSSDPAAEAGDCLMGAFNRSALIGPVGATMTLTYVSRDVRFTFRYDVPRPKVVNVMVDRAGPSVVPNLRHTEQTCHVLLLDAALEPVAPQYGCVDGPIP